MSQYDYFMKMITRKLSAYETIDAPFVLTQDEYNEKMKKAEINIRKYENAYKNFENIS